MTEPLGRAHTRALLARHGVRPRKALGQHFLVDPNIVRRTVEIAGIGPGSNVVEVGAGAGTLTRALAAAGGRVVAFEVDASLQPVLAETLAGLDVDVRWEEATVERLAAVVAEGRWSMVANLPYNVGTPLLLSCLRQVPSIDRFVVMLQREAVERLAAGPGSKIYGVPSVVAGLYGNVEVAMRVSPAVFVPPPEVESAVAVIDRVPAPKGAALAADLAHAAFGQRRKMLRSSLRNALPDAIAALDAAGIDPRIRAEDVSPEEYLRLAGVVDP